MNVVPLSARPAAEPTLTADEIAQRVVAAAVWAPSVHNTQPWWFCRDANRLSLRADSSRQLPAADPSGREMLISCGAALFTARLALRVMGRIPDVRLLPDPVQPLLIAELSWARAAASTDGEQRLFRQVWQRRTHRGGFDPLPLPPTLLSVLRAGAEHDGVMLRVVADDARRAALAAAVETAEQAMRLDSEYARELACWASPPGSTRRDGVPCSSYPAHPDRTNPHYPSRDFGRGHGWGQPGFSRAAFSTAGVVCLLTTAADRPADWVCAGQALQRILLTATASGVAVALHSQPLELPWLRGYIRSQLADGGHPQLVLRLGTVIQTAASVRRPPADVLLPASSQAGSSYG